jgi:hypothetical protein
MPILSYFLVVGSLLTGLLLWFGDESQPHGTAVVSSESISISKFKPEPEPEHARATTVNFAAEYERSDSKPVKAAVTPRKQKATTNSSESLSRSRFAGFPHDNLSIH